MEYPETIPVMMLPNATLFPNTMLPLFIFEPRYRKMLQRTLQGDRLIAVAMLRPDASREVPYKTAGLGMVRAAVKHPDGTSHVILQGLGRIKLNRATTYKPFRSHRYEVVHTSRGNEDRVQILRQKLLDLVNMQLEKDNVLSAKIKQCLTQHGQPGVPPESKFALEEVMQTMLGANDVEYLADMVSCTLVSQPQARQIILEEKDLETRLSNLVAFLMAEIFCRQRKKKP
ncbi:MAG: LON peptidase substrate-binding domain-containing protein [Verrucomicrobiota bacterium]|jgi:ATP-dependent Lon protease